MDHFNYLNHELLAESVALREIATRYGTPCYVYSRATLERHWHAFNDALREHDHLICYAVKANSNLAILNVLARLGSGFDVVSGGELQRVIHAGGDANKIVFSGVGKTADELRMALQHNIHCINVESLSELRLLNDIAAQMKRVAPVSLRINPDVDAQTHPYISTGLKENKFGIALSHAKAIYLDAKKYPHIQFIGVDCHIGSQQMTLEPFLDALDRLLLFIDEIAAAGCEVSHIDLGGGLGVSYKNETPPHPTDYANAIKEKIGSRKLKIILEPGRAIIANAGVLLTQVLFIKSNEEKHFAVVDAAMNDLVRPALYGAWQDIITVDQMPARDEQMYDVVGPVCETGDFLGKNRKLRIAEGDQLAIRGTGAYGFSMSSNYNSRPRAAEVMVDGDQHYLIRRRESIEQLFADEILLP